VGLVVGAVLASFIAYMTGYYWQVMLPGSLLGLIVGYATYRYRSQPRARAAA
jgi:hypothetical protein